ncbi:Beta carbonic anhydrase 5 [Nymphaea thermarum]|nr:Beta carbonic anhydrase 5 [Nymphaea thermarum]
MAAAIFSSSSSLSRDGLSSSGHLPVPPSRGQPDSLKISDSRSRSSVEVGSLSFKASREATVLAKEIAVFSVSDSEKTAKFQQIIGLSVQLLPTCASFNRKNLDHFQNLAEAQAPKFMVIACADSRVCPSKILGIQPGDAFTIRNVANLVPAFESGPSETNAALEFAVNTLEASGLFDSDFNSFLLSHVGNIFVIGHSRCGGIRALMSMQNEANASGFLENWVVTGRHARAAARVHSGSVSFDHQCKHCEKESINQSLLRLLTYPWIEDKVRRGKLSIHGGYYDFISCTFEKWTLDYKGRQGYAIKDRCFWS